MSEQTSFITKKIAIASHRILIAWVLLVLLPIAASIVFLDYFIAEYIVFAESGKISEAFNELEAFKNSLVVENFLTARLPELASIRPQAADAANFESLKGKIDKTLGGSSLICMFFDAGRQKATSITHRPDDLAEVVFPPAALLKKQLASLKEQQAPLQTKAQDLTRKANQRRNALSIQQIFKTLTPVTLKPNQVVKNFSAQFGGDLYFIYCEFTEGIPGIGGFLAVFRGREMSNSYLLSVLKRKFPYCRVITREQNIELIEREPARMNSGIRHLGDRIVITSPADQRFIRHVVHGGGYELLTRTKVLLPYLEYQLLFSRMQHQFSSMKPAIRLVAAILLGLSGLYCLRIMLFGVNLNSSFKQRILATTLFAAVFPFGFFSATFYLHQQYDDFLKKINLLQHINTRLATFNSQLDHYISWVEGTLSIFAQQVNMTNFNSDTAILKIFDQIGSILPVTRLALQRTGNTVIREFQNRSSADDANDSSDVLQVFFPMRTLQLLRETAPLDRKRQDELLLPGATIKISMIGQSLTSNGSLFNIEHSGLPIWISNYRVVDESLPGKPVQGLILSRFEPAPLISTFLEQSSAAKTGFKEISGDYEIRYAFFPVERTGRPYIWPGSGFTRIEAIRQASEKRRSETVVLYNSAGEEEFLVNRLNHGVPHTAIAYATPVRATTIFSGSLFAVAGSIFYLFLILLLTNRLLEVFFVRPVIAMAASAEQIARGRDSWSLELRTGDELEELNRSFTGLVKGLQQRNMLKDYVSEDAFSDITATSGLNLAPGGEYCEATILFAALKDYHHLTANLAPHQIVELLNAYISLGDQTVIQHNGSLDKILNHTLMLVFREVAGESESHALRAAKAALWLAEITQSRLSTGIYAGIASGTVISGKIGSYNGKLDFTVIGNPVNLAARLKTEASTSTTGLIISGSTMRLLKGKGKVNFLRRCSLKGKAREYNIYELYDLRNS